MSDSEGEAEVRAHPQDRRLSAIAGRSRQGSQVAENRPSVIQWQFLIGVKP